MTLKLIPALLLGLLLAGCNRQSSLNPGGTAAREISHLNWFVLILFSIVAIVMWALIAVVVSRPRGSLREHEPIDVGGGHDWVIVGGFAIPAAILAVVFITGLSAMSKFPMHDGMLMPAQIRITGHQWWWTVQYMQGPLDQRVTTANEIHIPAGQPIDIDLASTDVIHSFWVPSLHGKVDLIPGMMNRIRIEADHPGTYRGQCAEYCGEQHANMILLVVAQAPDQFQRWLAEQRQQSAPPETAQQAHGQELFMSRPCSLCHTIRGTLANGRVGPDLTHLASRQMIATNMLGNNPANLAAWATHAQSLKPGVVMPNVTQFNGEELNALVAYLQHFALRKGESAKSIMRDYLGLTKPRITVLILVSTAIGFFFGMPHTGKLVPWLISIEPWRFLNTLLGTGLMASGTAALNQWYERDVDRHRTARRPIPSGRLKASRALLFGLLVSITGFAELAGAVNLLSAGLGLFTLLAYLLVYTPLKLRSPLCTTVGAIPGAMPPIIGFAGAHGSLTLDAWALAAILFIWQFPHFYAIAWRYRDDYASGGIKMLPVLEPNCRSTVRRMIFFGAALVPVSLFSWLLGMAGPVYAAGAIMLGGWYLIAGVRAAVERTHDRARKVVLTSVMYLSAIYALILVDRVS